MSRATSTLTGFLSLACLVAVACGRAVPDPAPEPEVAQVQQAAGALDARMTVRGSWVIEVRDPDGTLAARHEFENVYTDDDNVVAQVLARARTVGPWWIALSGSPCLVAASPAPCEVMEADYPRPDDPSRSKNLSVAFADHAVALTGSVVVNATGSITGVLTANATCDATVAPSQCGPTGSPTSGGFLTQHTFAIPDQIAVVNGQQVLVTVNLEFAPVP